MFCSGGGRSLANLIERSRRAGGDPERLDAEVAVVVTSRACLAEERARGAGVPVVREAGVMSGDRALALVEEHRVDLVVLAGYLRLFPVPSVLAGRVINIHPALLPPRGEARFGGKGMHGMRVHERVLEAFRAGEVSESGCTVHFVDERYDEGEVILQRACPIEADDTAETLAARVFGLELVALPEAIGRVLA